MFAACIHRLEHIARKAEIAGQYSAAVGATRSLMDESSTAFAKRMGLTGMTLANGASAAESWDWMACTMSSAPAGLAPTRTTRWLRRSTEPCRPNLRTAALSGALGRLLQQQESP